MIWQDEVTSFLMRLLRSASANLVNWWNSISVMARSHALPNAAAIVSKAEDGRLSLGDRPMKMRWIDSRQLQSEPTGYRIRTRKSEAIQNKKSTCWDIEQR